MKQLLGLISQNKVLLLKIDSDKTQNIVDYNKCIAPIHRYDIFPTLAIDRCNVTKSTEHDHYSGALCHLEVNPLTSTVAIRVQL